MSKLLPTVTNRSQIYITTDGQLVSPGILSSRSDFSYCRSDRERTGLSFTTAAGTRQLSHSETLETHDHILLPHIRDSFNLEGQVPVFISPRNRVTQLYTWALGSIYVTSYGTQGYGGGIRIHLHTNILLQNVYIKVLEKIDFYNSVVRHLKYNVTPQ
jgi:hypothetical protein